MGIDYQAGAWESARNTPTASYAFLTPDFQNNIKKYKGGQFLDGRAKSLKEQAKMPILNPVEMNMPSEEFVIARLEENASYVKKFKEIYGNDMFKDINKTYNALADAIASFEKTKIFASFDSKYDKYLEGKYEPTVLEDLGMALFFSENNTNCASYHKLKRDGAKRETFTNYEYHNIGVPKNPLLKDISINEIGLLDNPLINDIKQKGKFRVPTLRNVAITAPYMHNGVFKNLKTVIEFYDKFNNQKRLINPETNEKWGEEVVSDNISKKELKAKILTERKINALVAFLEMLTDERYEKDINISR